jgi:glycine/D-amino acid oxidase-like deaminating enzyme/nitrite reductase/ring-hydroxylating ferredoxin subunit
MNTRSIWEGTGGGKTTFPVLEGNHKADVVIVGGGITGLTAAMLLSKSSQNVIVVEARQIGLGTTGNSTGNLYVTVDEHLSNIRKKWNDQVMKDVVRSRREAMSLIESNIKQFNIECDYEKQPFTYYVENMDDTADEFIKEEFDALKAAGEHPVIFDDVGLPFKTVKGLRVEGQAQFHPLKYVRGLAEGISGNCKIFEESRVLEIDEKEGIVKTLQGSVKADKILLATHTPVGVYMIHSVLAPYREFGVAAEINEKFPGGINWSVDSPKHSIRSYTDNGKNYVMVIGDKFKTGQHGDSNEYIQSLEKYLKDRLDVSNFKYFWGGQQYRSADGLPYIGKHSDKIYFLTGFATDGLTYGTLAAMIVSDQLSGKTNPWEEMYKADRFTPLRSAKDFIKENVDNIIQYLKDTPWNADADSLREVKRGEGKIIEKDQDKLAVYRDEEGNNHVVSAVCTHMKCVVNWNESEKSWDCPCHGSRFNVDGEVIEGPAMLDLSKNKTVNNKS